MEPVSLALLGGGLLLRAVGNYQANLAQADAEEANARFYREQADFARTAGDRAQLVFDRESVVLYGEQASAFAKAGVSTSGSALFMAKEMLFRQQESYAIKQESDFNVKLAMLRADESQKQAERLRDPSSIFLSMAAGGIQAATSIL